jgi:hypothetical protein
LCTLGFSHELIEVDEKLLDITKPPRYREGGCNPRIFRASFGVATWSPKTSMILAAISTSAALLGAILPFSR